MIFGNAADGKAAQLTMSQQLEMYRNCVITYKDNSARFADGMCSCTVGTYMRNIPAKKPGTSAIRMQMRNRVENKA
jgi:hypothetical protein